MEIPLRADFSDSQCPVCLNKNLKYNKLVSDETRQIECELCGKYECDEDCYDAGGLSLTDAERAFLSSLIREHNIYRDKPYLYLSESNVRELLEGTKVTSINQKVEKILKYLVKITSYYGQTVRLDLDRDFPIAYCKNREELIYLLNYLHDCSFLTNRVHSGQMELTPRAFHYIEDLKLNRSNSVKAFVAMSFSKEHLYIYKDAIEPAIHAMGYLPNRVDGIEHNGKIDDLIIGEIKESKFLVADVTGHKAGVYFEAGYALALGMNVIWCCQDSDKKDIHFDTRQFNHILWTDTEDLQKRLYHRINSTIGRPKRS